METWCRQQLGSWWGNFFLLVVSAGESTTYNDSGSGAFQHDGGAVSSVLHRKSDR